jgi:hypothetical protein
MRVMVLDAAGQWIDVAELPEVARLIGVATRLAERRREEKRPGNWDELELQVATEALRA